MRKSLPSLVIAALCFAAGAQTSPVPSTTTTSQTAVPRLIRFSGQINVPTGTVAITFTLHKQQQDNVTLWTETQNIKLDASGRYSVLLGATKAEGIPSELFSSGEAQWLGIKVEGQAELPRVLLVSVPYAMKAAEAETLAGHSASDFVTSENLNTVVQQQIQQQATNGTNGTPVKKNAGAKTNVPTNNATNFTDTTTNQVVLVTQSGTGSGLVANVVSGNGISGSTTSATGIGAAGINTAASGVAVGLRGSTVSGDGIGIYGTSTGTSGAATGIKGITAAPNGYGVFAQNTAATGPGVGFRGTTASTSGIGLYATSTASTGNTIGMRTSVASASGTSAVFQNTASGKLFSGQSGAANTEVFSVDGIGTVTSASQFVSNIASGTAPLVVKSNTVVPNLNASYMQGYGPSDFAQLSSGGLQIFYQGIQANGTTTNSAGGTFQGGTDQVGVEAYGGPTSGATGILAIDARGGAGASGGPGVSGLGGSATTNTGGDGGRFSGGSGGSAANAVGGNGIYAAGAYSTATAAPGNGVEAIGGAGTSSIAPGHGVHANGGQGTGSNAQGGTGVQSYGGYVNGTSGIGGVGIAAYGGGASSGTGGDGLWATPGGGGFGIPYAARFFGQVSINSPASGNTLQMQVGDPGCGAGFLGFGIGPVSGGLFTMTSCNNYNLISNGTDLLFNVPSGGAMHFRQSNGDNMAITSSGYVTIAHSLFVGGNLSVTGSISAGTKDFVIDDPLDPKNKLLYHTSIESPDMKTLYDGVVKLDAKGEAWVQLPAYFEALNQDFRYMLTPLGRSAPNLYVAARVKNNRFKISGGKPNMEVSWLVTGIRHDAFARTNPAQTEVEKPLTERGKYIHPEAFGGSPEDAMNPQADAASGALAKAQAPKN
ncbi:hypothetical protein Acid345_4198 [Candidatus Koribacter versatilis Ellin345]|uniref:Uncharacterized protein n=1 Tax=Koribacter versatilis (strain Ellin345) TaxID=204669 RepID=Q1IIV2_KORVE|nr:hypothetical protein [Candidatus Koribacter versatilis]ABF43198.1 hypothetical protein Acid345_4198 [Candidatus Koribacter versatilis Ellin345]